MKTPKNLAELKATAVKRGYTSNGEWCTCALSATNYKMHNSKVEWNIDPILRDKVDTGEVQIWADVPKETAAFIVKAVNLHQVLLNIVKNLDYLRHGKFDSGCEVCEVIAKAEGKE